MFEERCGDLMEIKNCKSCGKIFNYFAGNQVCPTCTRKSDDQFDIVKDYIYEHPGAGIQEVAEECKVSTHQIKKWVREERLEFAEDSLVGIECENCGISIRTGKFCAGCKSKLTNDLNSLYKNKKKPSVERSKRQSRDHKMRFLE